MNQPEVTGIYRILSTTTAEYILFSSAHGTFTKVDHNFKKFRRIEIIPNMSLNNIELNSKFKKT